MRNVFDSIKRRAFGAYQRAVVLMSERSPCDCIVLMLHRIRETSGETFDPQRIMSVPPGRLEELLCRLRASGVTFISLDELLAALRERRVLQRCVALTLDDCFADNRHVAQPILESVEVPYAVFAVSGYVNRNTIPVRFVAEQVVALHDSVSLNSRRFTCRTASAKYAAYNEIIRNDFSGAELHEFASRHGLDPLEIIDTTFMNRVDLEAMSRSGLCTVGSHTVTHPRLRSLSAKQLTDEFVCSKREIEQCIGEEVRYLAYPYGSCYAAGRREYRVAEVTGYECAFTTIRGGISQKSVTTSFSLPRVNVGYSDTVDVGQFVKRLIAMFATDGQR